MDVAEELAEMVPIIIETINSDFADSMLLVAQVLADEPEATWARALSVDLRGVDIEVGTPGGTCTARVEFPDTVTEVEMLTAALLGLVSDAAEVSGGDDATEAEQRAQELQGIRTFLTEVVAVEDIHPHLRQITFGGGDLVEFAPCGPDTFLYLLLPPAGRSELTIDQGFSWEQHAVMEEAEKPVGAYYTLRRWRPETSELDILMVLHGDSGPASAWAMEASPGNPVALWGPRTAYAPPEGTDRLVLVVDETALPAAAVILETMPSGCNALVIAEVANESERQLLPGGPGIDVAWIHRGSEEAGTTTNLVDAVRALPQFGDGVYVWGGGESRAMTAVRRHVRDDRGLPAEAVSLVAYWRRSDR